MSSPRPWADRHHLIVIDGAPRKSCKAQRNANKHLSGRNVESQKSRGSQLLQEFQLALASQWPHGCRPAPSPTRNLTLKRVSPRASRFPSLQDGPGSHTLSARRGNVLVPAVWRGWPMAGMWVTTSRVWLRANLVRIEPKSTSLGVLIGLLKALCCCPLSLARRPACPRVVPHVSTPCEQQLQGSRQGNRG